MSEHEKAYTKAYTPSEREMSRRGYRTGSLFQRCEARFGCPPLVDGIRPKHKCKGRWFGVIEAGVTADGDRNRTTVSHKSKSVVQQRLNEKVLEAKDHQRNTTKRTVTVAAWAKTWLEAIQPEVRPTSYETDRAAVRWITKTIGHIKLADLDPEDVRSIAAAIRREGGSSSTALRYHGSLIRMLKAAAMEGYNVPPNVLLGKKPKKAVHDRQALSTPECIQVLAHIQRRDQAGALVLPDASRWALAFLQGIRQAEALGLTWEHVDLAANTMTICWQVKSLRYVDRTKPELGFVIPDGYEAKHLVGATHLVRPKSRAGWRVMPLIPWAGKALEQWQEVAPANPHGLIWSGRAIKSGTWPRNPASDREQWEAIQAAAKVAHPSGRPYHVHEIRHSTATLLMDLKVAESVRIAIMGHSAISSTRPYEHADMSQLASALEGVAGVLELG